MCGFAGVVAWDERYRTSSETLARMSAAIAHRGPDGEGTFFNHAKEIAADHPQCALAFRRLAVLDLDQRANQPFTLRGKTIVFNGEIYNFRDLRRELSSLRPDHQWRTTGDTEVLLVAFDVWAEKCLDHLNGMFALAVWDQDSKSLFLARDRMGQKPLYVARASSSPAPGAIAFASESGALQCLPWLSAEISRPALGEYLRWGCIGNTSTLYAGVTKVAPGTWRRHTAGNVDCESYFSPNTIPPRPQTGPDVRQRVLQAVERQLVADVPLGCFLSGGIDSSVIALAMKLAGQHVFTFSIGFKDSRYDETPFAAAVADHLKTTHRQFTVEPDASADLVQLARVFGEPFGDSSALPTHYLARETRRHVKVALSGDGGDELFGGYDRYRAMHLDRLIRKLPTALRATLARRGNAQLGTADPKSKASRLHRLLGTLDEPPARRYSSYLRLFTDAGITQLMTGPMDLPADQVQANYECFAQDRDLVAAALATDRVTYLPDDLLTKLDRASMLHALEVRSPFMDHELVRFAAGFGSAELLGGGPKRMLRDAFAADLPDFVFKRKKMGFAVPIGEWFRGALRPMLRDHLFATDSFASQHFNLTVVERLLEDHQQKRTDHSQRLYALLMLELWWGLAHSHTGAAALATAGGA
jgi:asparagine synthase (glutamine-hydrolysing)